MVQLHKQFKTQDDCIKYLEQLRWNGKPRCPYCNNTKQTPLPKEQRYHCNACRSTYSVTVGTMFQKTKIDLKKWFSAIPLVVIERISARQLSKTIGITKDSACFMVQRIRIAYKEQFEFVNHFLTTQKYTDEKEIR
jgi:transposase-like protein